MDITNTNAWSLYWTERLHNAGGKEKEEMNYQHSHQSSLKATKIYELETAAYVQHLGHDPGV
jgi:hypothetical protein